MTKWTQLIFGLLIIISCTPTRTEKITWFESDWIFVRDTSKFQFDPRYIGLRFRNDTMITISDLWLTHEGRYSVKGNQIQVFDEDSTDFVIIKLTMDSLILLGYSDTLRYYNRTLEFDKNLTFQKIILQGGQCFFRKCPEFELTIDDKGNTEFKGLKNSKFRGTKNYSIDVGTKNRIDSLFKWTNIATIDTTDFYSSEDDWGITITFVYGDSEMKKIRGTHGSMPHRLKGIIRTLLDDIRRRGLV